MSNGTAKVPPRLVKANLRRIVGGHVRAGNLGHYLDFDVVVIPPGKHVTEFPTADAAFHPYENQPGARDDDEHLLEIRIVPWIIFKISANEELAKKLAVEIGNFWRAGVEQIWEIRGWNRTIALHVPGGSARVFAGGSRFPACPVLPGLEGEVADLFSGGEDEEALPQSSRKATDSWKISQRFERKGEGGRGKSAYAEFVPSPNSEESPYDLYRPVEIPRGFRAVAETVLGSWGGRIILGALILVILTTTIYLILETHSLSGNRPKPEVADPGTVLSPEARIELAKATVSAYFETDSPEARLEFVRHPDTTRPRMVRFYDESPVRRDVISLFGTPTEIRSGDREFLALPAYMGGHQSELFLEEIGDGGFLVDWESEVGYNETRFPVFRSHSKPDPTEFRVFATESDQYSGSFSSEEKYYAVLLHFPESGESALGFMDREAKDFPAFEKRVSGQYRLRIRVFLDRPESGRPGADEPEVAPENEPASPSENLPPKVRVRIVGLVGESWLSVD